MYERPRAAKQPSIRVAADRLSAVHSHLKTSGSPLGVAIMEIGRSSSRIGEVMDGIRGTGDLPRHIRHGHQYVGAFPADHWQTATGDAKYRTLSFGIKTFPERWSIIRPHITRAVHYISIGPGTGEKDRQILEHLQSLLGDNQTIVYVPIDISSELLDISLGQTLPAVDRERIEFIPIRMDITDGESLERLKQVLDVLMGGARALFSLLGNTLANFGDDEEMLGKLSSLISPNDMFLVELATVDAATAKTARTAAMEYEGSDSFHRFAMAALCDYTDCTTDNGRVVCQGDAAGDLVEVVTSYAPNETMTVKFRTGGEFHLNTDESIELYRSRKYTEAGEKHLLRDFTVLERRDSMYSAGGAFGVATSLLQAPAIKRP